MTSGRGENRAVHGEYFGHLEKPRAHLIETLYLFMSTIDEDGGELSEVAEPLGV